MKPDSQKMVSLYEEVENSVRLVRAGLRELKRISGANDFYYLPFLLLAAGLERLGKCIFCFHHLKIQGRLPDSRDSFPAGRKGHDVGKLIKWIADTLYTRDYLTRPAAREDFRLLSTDPVLTVVIRALSDFGQSARYYHLDVVLGQEPATRDPARIWQGLEFDLLKNEEGWEGLMSSGNLDVAYDIINRQLVIPLERLVRALCRLFTLGPLGTDGRVVTGLISPFLMIRDDELGKKSY